MLQNQDAVHINLSHNALPPVCLESGASQANLIDLSYNKITYIKSNCFHGLSQLFLIALRNNFISYLESFSIRNISSSFSIDLSDNNITTLSKYSITNATNVVYLLLTNNPILIIVTYAISVQSIDFIHACQHSVCCNQIANQCTSSFVEPCRALLPTLTFKVIFPIVFVSVLAFNLFSIMTNIWTLWKQHLLHKKYGKINKRLAWPYNFIVLSINVTDILCGVYLLIIWYGDMLYKSLFPAKKYVWTNSILCSLATTVVLIFSLLSPLLSAYLSVSRYVAVRYPFSWTCRSLKFTYRTLLVIVSCTLSFTAVIETTLQLVCETAVTGLCLPFLHHEFDSCLAVTCLTLFVGVLLIIALIFNAAVHFIIIVTLKGSRQIASSNFSTMYNVLLQFILLSISSAISWIPSSLIFSVSLFSSRPPYELQVLTVGLILPLNSIINPMVVSVFLLRQGTKSVPVSWKGTPCCPLTFSGNRPFPYDSNRDENVLLGHR